MRKVIILGVMLCAMSQAGISAAQTKISWKPCNSCDSCNAALEGNAQYVMLTNDIEKSSGSCIDVSNISGKVFDCDYHSISNTYPYNLAGGIKVDQVSDIEIRKCFLNEWQQGIQAWHAQKLSIHHNVIRNANSQLAGAGYKITGIEFGGSLAGYTSANKVYNNYIYDVENGILLYSDSRSNVFKNNTIRGYDSLPVGSKGIYLRSGAEGNIFEENEIYDMQIGVYIIGAGNNFYTNVVKNNASYGIRLTSSTLNTYLYGNYVTDNGQANGFSSQNGYDIRAESNSGALGNWGDENTCKKYLYWHDNSVTFGCTHTN